MYVLGAQKNRLNETVLLSTHNICFGWEIKNSFPKEARNCQKFLTLVACQKEQSDQSLPCLHFCISDKHFENSMAPENHILFEYKNRKVFELFEHLQF